MPLCVIWVLVPSLIFVIGLICACLWLFHTLTLERAARDAQKAVQLPSPLWPYPATPGVFPAPAGLTLDEMQKAANADHDADARKVEAERYIEEFRAEFPELAYALAQEKEPDAEPVIYE